MAPSERIVGEFLQAASDTQVGELPKPVQRHDRAPPFRVLETELAANFPAVGGFQFPASLKLLYAHVLPAIDCGLIRWMPSAKHRPLDGLHQLLFDAWSPSNLAGVGIVPIADDGNDGGPLSLDVRELPAEFAPVVIWDHERQTISAPMYDNFDSLLQCSTHLLRARPVRDLGPLGGSGAAREFDWWDD